VAAAATRRQDQARNDFVVVANRLPVDSVTNDDGSTGWRTSPGGLVTALEPVMRANNGAWIGWPGNPDERFDPFVENDMTLIPMSLSTQEVELYYEGFSNGTIWPLYHDVIVAPEFHREWWDAYVAVNRRFAEHTAEVAAERATVWVHDYQLQLVPAMLREMRPDLRIGFFLHIPFPPAELFLQVPWRRQILQGLLGADLVGFQRPGAAANFVRLVRDRLGYKTHRDRIVLADGRVMRASAYPISIDVQGLEELAREPDTAARAEEIRSGVGDPQRILLGIDRLDYTKGIRQRLHPGGDAVARAGRGVPHAP
jgi:trehalose 6-phosphate synthase